MALIWCSYGIKYGDGPWGGDSGQGVCMMVKEMGHLITG